METFLRLHAYPKLGGRPIGSVRRSEIQACIKALTGVLAPATVELVSRGCRPSSKAAGGDRLIASAPCIRIALPKRNDAEVVPLTVTEVEALAAQIGATALERSSQVERPQLLPGHQTREASANKPSVLLTLDAEPSAAPARGQGDRHLLLAPRLD